MAGKKTFYILDDPYLPTFYNHRYFVEKFASGFALNGFEVKVAKSVAEVKDGGIVMVSKHGFMVDNLLDKMKKMKGENREKRYRLGNRIVGFLGNIVANPGMLRIYLSGDTKKKAEGALRKLAEKKDTLVIAWLPYEYIGMLEEIGFDYVISGPYFYKESDNPKVREWMHVYRTDRKALPINFAAAVDPAKVGAGCTNDRIKVSYVGNRSYCPEYYEMFAGKEGCRIVPTPPYIPEEERLAIYRESMITLGLQKPLQTTMVTERVYESLAYGALCFSNKELPEKATGGIAKYIKDKEHLAQMVEHYVADRKERAELRERGFEFIRNGHTYKHEADKFLERARELYGFRF